MPAGDIIRNAVGLNGYQPNRFREIYGVFYRAANRTCNHPTDDTNGEALFSDDRNGVLITTAQRICAAADAMSAAEAERKNKSNRANLFKQTGVRGHSLFFSPSHADGRAPLK